MTRSSLIWIATLGSAGLLGGAFAFQYFGGLIPCILCLYQRWPHGVAILIGLLALRSRGAGLPLLGMLAMLITAGIGFYHAGVELGWFSGLATCTVDTLQGITAGDLLNTDIAVGKPVGCDEVPWAMLGVSMAGWNAILSAGLAGIWGLAARKV
ncbi:MAG: disulfide bond formation protein B [Cypionkella sp.]|uniref:disulfide bond formation protein B n=1 Tax=Cypionkella sp. TaxID=2811411 RepID=UPI002AB99FBA|nr:disulfide bond formation protein B [Cypionkella sp.]MDZ4312875.1 disulfide bond formation protein B [Cypionkella sp.]MDZ4396005.1 disulfide bond formation protein B [Cypionkella sp.]